MPGGWIGLGIDRLLTGTEEFQLPRCKENMNTILQSDTHGLVVPSHWPAWLLTGLVLFGIGFGFVEAVVVVDLRAILEPVVGRAGGMSGGQDRFPLIAFDRLEEADPTAARL